MSRKFLYLDVSGNETEDEAFTSQEISSTMAGFGASLLGVADINNFFTSNNQEGVNNEIYQAILNLTEANTFPTRGESFCLPNEETFLVSYTVGMNNSFLLKRVLVSGDNIAKFIIKKNDEVIATVRTWYGNFNDKIPFDNTRLNSNDVVSVFAVNTSQTSEMFEATILGEIK